MKRWLKWVLLIVAILWIIGVSIVFYTGCKDLEFAIGMTCSFGDLIPTILVWAIPSYILIILVIIFKKETNQLPESN